MGVANRPRCLVQFVVSLFELCRSTLYTAYVNVLGAALPTEHGIDLSVRQAQQTGNIWLKCQRV